MSSKASCSASLRTKWLFSRKHRTCLNFTEVTRFCASSHLASKVWHLFTSFQGIFSQLSMQAWNWYISAVNNFNVDLRVCYWKTSRSDLNVDLLLRLGYLIISFGSSFLVLVDGFCRLFSSAGAVKFHKLLRVYRSISFCKLLQG